MKRKLIMAIVGLGALAAMAAAGLHWWFEGRHWESTDNAYLAANITALSARVPGPVAVVNVRENQVVAKGDLLFAIAQHSYIAQRDRAQAEVAKRAAELAHLQTRIAQQQANIGAAAAEVNSSNAELTRARQDLGRAETLQAKGFTDRQRYDHAKIDLQSAQAGLGRDRANLEAANAKSRVLAEESAELQAKLDAAEAELRLAEISLFLTEVRAPANGVIGNKQIEVGEYALVGARKLALVELDDVWVTANFKETQLTEVVPGQHTVVKVDAFPDQQFSGVVESLSPASGAKFSLLPPDNATGNFTKIVQRVPVKIVLDRGQPLLERLKPGMSVIASIDLRTGQAPGQPVAQGAAP
ncbi:MAG TPA: HlyD family secretion protein [Porticoccaceae bacterium]|nr:HlyD family secretion protein [Porticoccaceae bacterium]